MLTTFGEKQVNTGCLASLGRRSLRMYLPVLVIDQKLREQRGSFRPFLAMAREVACQMYMA